MSTIAREFTKEQLQQIIETDHVQCGEASSLARIALASLEVEPVAYMYKDNLHADARFSLHTRFGNWSQEDINEYEITEIPLYTAPPAPVSVPDLKPVGFLFVSDDGAVAYSPADWPMKGFNLIGQIYGDLNACRAAMLQGSQPVSQTYNLPELIEGMEVSIDVSTCDADLGNRYFGTVTEASELDTAKNGYILLVKDAEPNFDVNGNSPVIPGDVLSAILKVARVRADFDDFDGDRRGIGDCLDEAEQELIVTINKYASQLAAEPIAPNDVREQTAIPQAPVTPDGWISCSERMPDDGQHVIILCDGAFVLYAQYRDGEFFDIVRNGDEFFETQSRNVTHWMPLPAAPQQEAESQIRKGKTVAREEWELGARLTKHRFKP